MNKKVKVTSAAAAVLASLVLANANVNNEVKADTKPVNPTAKTTEKAQTPEEAARANVASAQKNVETEQGNVDKAKDDLDQAKKDAEKPDADYKTQSNKVDGLKKTVDQKNDALTDAKNKEKDAQALADEANKSAKVDAAKDAVTKQEDVVKDANAAKKTADQAVTDKQTEIDKLDKAVKTDTQDVNDKTAAKNQADQAVADAENALKGTGITDAKNAVDTYQGNIDNLNKNIEHNQGVLKNNNNALNDNQETLKKVNKKLDQAKSDTQAAKEKLDTDQATLDKKNQDLQKVKELARTAAGFFKSLAEDNSLTNEQREDAKTAYGILMNDGKFKNVKLTWYHPDQQLGKDGDATSLANMQSALNNLDDLVNVRKEYGLKLPHISLTATAIAMMSSDYLLTHNFDHPIHHPENGAFWLDEEDIAYGGYQVPMYMGEKDIIDAEIAKHPELKKYDFADGPLTQKKWEEAFEYWNSIGLFEDVGHYVSMTNPAQNSLGATNAGAKSSIDMLQSSYVGGTYAHQYPSFTIDQYKDLVNSYVANPNGANFVQTAQAAANSAQDVVNNDTEDYNRKLNNIQKPLEKQAKG